MEPVVVLHHFVHPQWFEDLGGFTEQDNIRYFVQYSCEVFRCNFYPRMSCVILRQFLEFTSKSEQWPLSQLLLLGAFE